MLIPAGIPFVAKKYGALIVINPVDFPAQAIKMHAYL